MLPIESTLQLFAELSGNRTVFGFALQKKNGKKNHFNSQAYGSNMRKM